MPLDRLNRVLADLGETPLSEHEYLPVRGGIDRRPVFEADFRRAGVERNGQGFNSYVSADCVSRPIVPGKNSLASPIRLRGEPY